MRIFYKPFYQNYEAKNLKGGLSPEAALKIYDDDFVNSQLISKFLVCSVEKLVIRSEKVEAGLESFIYDLLEVFSGRYTVEERMKILDFSEIYKIFVDECFACKNYETVEKTEKADSKTDRISQRIESDHNQNQSHQEDHWLYVLTDYQKNVILLHKCK